MTYFLISIALVILAAAILYFRAKPHHGEDLSKYDRDYPVFANASDKEGLAKLNVYLDEMFGGPAVAANSTDGWVGKRERFDAGGLKRTDLKAEYRPATIDVDGHTMTGSWTLVDGHDPDKRVLYMHGGAFSVGSDISHRALSVGIARRTGAAVFVPNYRLMPENTRRDGITDARAAYDWVLENGPDGPATSNSLGLGGDSAGGNLVLMLANWARDTDRRTSDAVITFSPTTDATLSSPSMKGNLEQDLMLKPLLAPILKAPRILLLPALAKHYGMSPAHKDQSPIFDDLSNLPPTLIMASRDEMLHDDGARYAAKMEATGSPVTFQSWGGGLPHVWTIFDDFTADADIAMDEVGSFLNAHLSG